ncbi:MAG: hypothetical protein M1826_001522 [Phylliscum demangeonii]|nr:MAG: hypothetical protein M1826_001522 [Phylliscum demangeonii]
MKSGPFVCAAASLLGLALARPVPDRLQPSTQHGGLLQNIGVASILTGVGAWLGAAHQSKTDNRKISQQTHSFDLARDEILRLKTQKSAHEASLEALRKSVDLQNDMHAEIGYKLKQLRQDMENQIPTPTEKYRLLARCWFHELEMAIRTSSAATWPDSIGDDLWAKCVNFNQNSNIGYFTRPSLNFKKAGASMQKKLGLFQDSAAASIVDRPMAFVHSPAVQHQMRNMRHVAAAGMREVHALEKFGAREEGALERAAVGFRAAGLLAGEV